MKRLLSAFILTSACAGGAQPQPEPPETEARPSPTAAPPTTAEPKPTPEPEVDAPAAEAAPPPRTPFPPADFDPPHARSAQPGDGKWTRLGDAQRGDRAAEGEPVMFRTTVHPHPISKWITVTVAAIDLQRAAFHLVAGTDDPSKDAPAELRTGLVAPEHQDSLLAVMNGGWKASHGRWGVMLGGHTFLAPRKEGCTIAIYRDGMLRIRPWPAIAPEVEKLEAYRQTPPCLLEGGELHALLKAGNERPWGGNVPNEKTRRRSALGVDASGRILFYGFGDEAGAKLLAEGLRIAGAVEAAETDINYSWTRFLLFGKPKPDAKLQVTSTLVPKMVHQKTGYVERAAPRDFFYVRRR